MDTVLTMKRSLVRLQRYVESMNSLQRLETCTPPTKGEFSNLCGQLAETGAILRGEGRFQFSAQGEGPLFLDSELLFQVFENLLSNAGRYAQQMVWARAELSEGSLSLTVSDDGPGFPPEALKRAAEPYYRGERTPRRGRTTLAWGCTCAGCSAKSTAAAWRSPTAPRAGPR